LRAPMYDVIRDDRRFDELLTKLGLTDGNGTLTG
jgi:hypothetical protein